MWKLFKNLIPFILVILKLCTSTFGNFTICDLSLICGLPGGTNITTPPPQCTALASYSKDLDGVHELERVKCNLPLVIIMRDIDFNIVENLVTENFDEVFPDYKNVDFDFMIFDNTYNYWEVISKLKDDYTQNIITFLDKAKTYFPGKKIGLVVGHEVESTNDKIDLVKINDHVDLFLLESTGYRGCNYHTHQADMNVLATKDDIQGSLSDLKSLGVPLNKVIYTIELKIESKKGPEPEDMAYSYLCANKLSDDRKYCFNSIQCIFDKARLHISEGTAGIYINGIQFDDLDGACGCKTATDGDACYRGLKTIAGASQEDKNDLSFYDCKEGAYPVIIS